MPMSQQDIEGLKQSLISDATSAKNQAEAVGNSRGAPDMSSFAPKSLRIKNKTFGEAELANVSDAFDRAVKHLAGEASFTDDVQRGLFEVNMKKKLNQYRMHLMRQAGEFEKRIAQSKMDETKKRAMMGAIGSLVSGASAGIIANTGKTSGPTPIADSMQAPSLGSQFSGKGPSLSNGGVPGLTPGLYGPDQEY